MISWSLYWVFVFSIIGVLAYSRTKGGNVFFVLGEVILFSLPFVMFDIIQDVL
jgi:hypothetical protein